MNDVMIYGFNLTHLAYFIIGFFFAAMIEEEWLRPAETKKEKK